VLVPESGGASVVPESVVPESVAPDPASPGPTLLPVPPQALDETQSPMRTRRVRVVFRMTACWAFSVPTSMPLDGVAFGGANQTVCPSRVQLYAERTWPVFV